MPPKKRKSRPSPSRKDRKNRKKKSLRSKEITLVALILIGVFFLISLISYDSQDPSWASSATATEKISNYAGKAGASAAELLLQIMGFAAFLVPLGLFYFGLQGLLPGKRERAFLKAGSFLFFVLLLCGLLHSLFDMVGWRGTEIPSGGLLGVVVSDALVRYFNHTGTLLILVGLLILLVMFSTRLSLGRILQVLAHFLGFMFKEIRLRITLHQKAKRRERMKKKVIEKYAPKKTEPEEEKKKKPHKKKIRLKKAKKPPTPPSVPPPEPAPVAKEKYLFPEIEKKEGYVFPPFNLLDPGKESEQVDKNELYQKKQIIEEKLGEFKIEGEVREYHPGPVLTTYEFSPYPGVKVSQVASYGEDLSLALRAESVRIQRIPGKSSLGIEVPNNKREIIKIRDIIQTEKFQKSPSKL
ncbi:MAG: DNA translocase FtsK 4TM domain-containing protein, partial [Candidatus Aminicenantales bacterium]